MNIFEIQDTLTKKPSSESLKPKSEAEEITETVTTLEGDNNEDDLGIPSGDMPQMEEDGSFNMDNIEETPNDEYNNYTDYEEYDANEKERELASLGDINENSINLAKNINEQFYLLLKDQTFNKDTFNNTNIYSFDNSEDLENVRIDYNNSIESLETYIKTDLIEDSISTRTSRFLEYKKIFHDLNIIITSLLKANRS